MLGRLIALVVLATVAFVAWNRGWTIDEAQVRQFYDRQLVAFRDFDHEAMCKDLAGDYRARLVQYADGRRLGETVLDSEGTCEMTRQTMEELRRLHARSRGLIAFDVRVDIGSIRVAPGRRSATVEVTTTIKLGEMLIARSRGTERLSRTWWRVRSHGGEGQTWSYVY